MLKRYLEKLISFGCSLQDVPRVDVVYEMPEGQNYHLVKYISGKQGCLYVDIDAFKKENQKTLFALFTELRRYYQDYKCETKINQNVQKKTNLKTSLNNLEKIE